MVSWRFFFSPRRALLNYLKTNAEFMDVIDRCESKPWQECQREINSFHDEKIKRSSKIVRGLFINPLSILGRKRVIETKMRLLIAGAMVRSYEKKNGRFPLTLDELDSASMIDPITGSTWHYIVYRGDFAIIYSTGLDLEENGGDEEKDIIIFLSAMSLRDYLEQEE